MPKVRKPSRAKNLEESILHNALLYYSGQQPEMTDDEWDSKCRELIDLGGPDVREQVAAGMFDRKATVPHDPPMLSLANSRSTSECIGWSESLRKFASNDDEFDNLSYGVMPKLDGMAVSISIERDGTIKSAGTRGSGTMGENIMRHMGSLLGGLKMDTEGGFIGWEDTDCFIQIRGEVIISESDFSRMNTEMIESGLALYSNPRNAVAGILNSHANDLIRYAQFLPYYYLAKYQGVWYTLSYEDYVCNVTNPIIKQRKGTPQTEWVFDSIEDGLQFIEKWGKTERSIFPFPTDGMVIRVLDETFCNEAGETSSYPRWSTAYKFAGQEVRTKLVGIEMQIGRLGALTPVAKIKPITLEGVVIKQATLHNIPWVQEMDLQIGDDVFVRRAQGVIPQVMSRIPGKKRSMWVPPSECPQCESVLDVSGKVWRCVNPDCDNLRLARLTYAVSKMGFDLDGVGPALIENLEASGLLRMPSDYFLLKREDVEALNLSGVGDATLDNLFAQIDRARNKVDVASALRCLGIRNLGRSLSRKIATALELNGSGILGALELDLNSLSGIGPETASRIGADIRDSKDEIEALARLTTAGTVIKPGKRISESRLNGKSFVITGKMIGTLDGVDVSTRDGIVTWIESNGGSVSSSVSSSTSFVIGDPMSGSTKMNKAKSLGVGIIESLEELEGLVR